MIMDITNQYSVYFGTVRGIVGQTNCKSGQPATYELKEAGKNAEITSFQWGATEDDILLGQRNGIVKFYSTRESKVTNRLENIEGEGPAVGVEAIDDRIVIARRSGHVSIWNNEFIDKFKVEFSNSDGTLDCMRYNQNRKNVIGTGGEANDFKLWDIETKKCIFRAKSLGHDNLNLPIPTSIRGICFFPGDEMLNACVTKEGLVLLYDERAQRRPVCKFEEPKASFTTVTTAFRDKQCMVGTTRGYMQLIDLKTGNSIKTYKMFTGSVTDIVCDPVNPLVFSVSLDRYLRVHNVDTKELLYKEYLKQSLTKVLIKPVIKEEKPEVDGLVENGVEANVDEEYDELFENMEVIVEKKSKKKLRRSDDEAEEKDVIVEQKSKKKLKRSVGEKEEKEVIVEKKLKKKLKRSVGEKEEKDINTKKVKRKKIKA